MLFIGAAVALDGPVSELLNSLFITVATDEAMYIVDKATKNIHRHFYVNPLGNRLDCSLQRLLDLAAAETLAVMRLLPGRCHELVGSLAGHLTMDLVHPDRLVFRPDHAPVPTKDGALVWELVTKIEVTGIGDYHN